MSDILLRPIIAMQVAVHQLREREDGQTTTEYAILLGFLAIAIIIALFFLRNVLRSLFSSAASSVSRAPRTKTEPLRQGSVARAARHQAGRTVSKVWGEPIPLAGCGPVRSRQRSEGAASTGRARAHQGAGEPPQLEEDLHMFDVLLRPIIAMQVAVHQLREREDGQTTTEYAILLGFLAIAIIIALFFLRNVLRSLFSSAASSVSRAPGG